MRTWKKAMVGLMALTVAAAGSLATVGVVAAQDDELVVGISWNNFAQPRWANKDRPAIEAAVQAAGGRIIERDANDSNEQQLADVARVQLIVLVRGPKHELASVLPGRAAVTPLSPDDRASTARTAPPTVFVKRLHFSIANNPGSVLGYLLHKPLWR